MVVLVRLVAGAFGLIAGVIATAVILLLSVAGLALTLLLTPFAAIAVAFGSTNARHYSGAFRNIVEWIVEKVSTIWRSLIEVISARIQRSRVFPQAEAGSLASARSAVSPDWLACRCAGHGGCASDPGISC